PWCSGRCLPEQREVCRQCIGLGREAESELLGEHEAIDRRLDPRRPGEGSACTGEARLIDCEGWVQVLALGEVQRVADMCLGIEISEGRLGARLRDGSGDIDTAWIDDGELEQAALGQ